MNNNKNKRPFTVAVEGNIGSGKTTFLKFYEDLMGTQVFLEPVDKWKNLDGINLLDLMYKEPNRHSFTFQSYVQLTMTEIHNAQTSKSVKMMERSLWSARHVFAENLARNGNMASSEFAVLSSWFDFLVNESPINVGVDLIIYLRTSPEIALERLRKRQRSEEAGVSLEYLKAIHDLHEEWISGQSDAPVIIIDADEDLEKDPDLYSRHEAEIQEALKTWQKSVADRSKPRTTLGSIGNLIKICNKA